MQQRVPRTPLYHLFTQDYTKLTGCCSRNFFLFFVVSHIRWDILSSCCTKLTSKCPDAAPRCKTETSVVWKHCKSVLVKIGLAALQWFYCKPKLIYYLTFNIKFNIWASCKQPLCSYYSSQVLLSSGSRPFTVKSWACWGFKSWLTLRASFVKCALFCDCAVCQKEDEQTRRLKT